MIGLDDPEEHARLRRAFTKFFGAENLDAALAALVATTETRIARLHAQCGGGAGEGGAGAAGVGCHVGMEGLVSELTKDVVRKVRSCELKRPLVLYRVPLGGAACLWHTLPWLHEQGGYSSRVCLARARHVRDLLWLSHLGLASCMGKHICSPMDPRWAVCRGCAMQAMFATDLDLHSANLCTVQLSKMPLPSASTGALNAGDVRDQPRL